MDISDQETSGSPFLGNDVYVPRMWDNVDNFTCVPVQNDFFLPLLDIGAPQLVKNLFKIIFKLASYVSPSLNP